MSLFDTLKKHVAEAIGFPAGAEATADAGAVAGAPPGLFDGLIALVQAKGVAAIVQAFKDKGLGNIIESWIGHGTNLPISAEQLQSVLGPEAIEALAVKLGLPAGQATALLAKVLPGFVDKMTPNGLVDEASILESEHVAPQTETTEG